MSLVSILRRAGGIMLTADLVRAGISPAQIKRAVASGSLQRPSRGWIAFADADPVMVRAAAARVVITCVTAAPFLGLWDVKSKSAHLAVAPNSHPPRVSNAHLHWSAPMVPRVPGKLIDAVPNVLAIVADCRPREEALAIYESALRIGKVTVDRMQELPLSARAREVLGAARPYADAGTESILFHRLIWLGLPMKRQTWILGHRVDLLIGDRLVIQIDGGHHVDAQRASDNEHDVQLRLAGYYPIRVTYWQLMNAWPRVQELILEAVAQGLHLARR